MLDDALLVSEDDTHPMLKADSLLPACQRIAGSVKYRKILMNPDLSEYIIGRIAVHERKHVLLQIQRQTGLNKTAAETLFQYMIHGPFAINKRHHFTKDASWYHDVAMLNAFVQAGYRAFH